MLKKNFYIIHTAVAFAISLCAIASFAQTTDELHISTEKVWTMDDCMLYAVKHSTDVKKRELSLSTAKFDKIAAGTAFLPSISANINGQYSWGRSIDPETNTYNNVTTFNNGYGIYVSMYLFDGGQIYNQWRQARIAHQQGLNDVQRARDDKAIEVMQAFVDAAYYQGCTSLAENKLKESRKTLHKAERQEELGIKGKPDVAQVRAQVAQDDYNLIHQRNLYNAAVLQLKTTMNMPVTDTLDIDTTMQTFIPELETEEADAIFNYASTSNPAAIAARLSVRNYKMQYNVSKGKLMPTISLSGGITTNYYRNMSSEAVTMAFRDQFKNNRGEYLSATLSIPIFDNLSRISGMRRARNQWRTAQVEQEEALRKLRTDISQAVMDRNGYTKEIIQMENKVKADSLAYHVAQRKFEEGMLNAIDLQTTSNTLQESKVTLLQKRMLYILKERLVCYYKENSFINEK